MLSTQVKTHYILIKEWDRNNIKKIAITKAEYELYEQELEMKKHNGFFKMYDLETKEMLFNGRANKIEWFEEIKVDHSLKEKRWVCWYWSRHEIIWFPDNCQCTDKFKVLSIQFKDELKKLWYKIFYDSDIKESMQKHYLRQLANNIT